MNQKEILAMAEKIVDILNADDHMASGTALTIASRLFDAKVHTTFHQIPDGTYSGKA